MYGSRRLAARRRRPGRLLQQLSRADAQCSATSRPAPALAPALAGKLPAGRQASSPLAVPKVRRPGSQPRMGCRAVPAQIFFCFEFVTTKSSRRIESLLALRLQGGKVRAAVGGNGRPGAWATEEKLCRAMRRAPCDSAAWPRSHQGKSRMGGNHRNSRFALHVEHTDILPCTSKLVHEPMVPFFQYFCTSAKYAAIAKWPPPDSQSGVDCPQPHHSN
jgi:hypothetical protein